MNTKEKVREGKYYNIVLGPSRDRLFDACKYAYDNGVNVSVEFTIVTGYTVPEDNPIQTRVKVIRVISVEHEDGSGESLNLRGHCEADLSSSGEATNRQSYRFDAYYSSKHREGCITFY